MSNTRIGFFALSAMVALLSTGCGAAIGDVRMGSVHAARAVDCKLEFMSVQTADMMPGARFGMGGELEQVGAVMIGANVGTDAMSEPMRALVRPRACKMGGEIITLVATGTGANYGGGAQQNIVFSVWARRAATAAQPSAF